MGAGLQGNRVEAAEGSIADAHSKEAQGWTIYRAFFPA